MRLCEVTPELRERVIPLAPHPEEERWAGRASGTLPAAERRTDRLPVVALAGGADEPVGFFVLDVGPTMPAVHGAGVVGVRGLFVAAEHQGRGHGGAMLQAMPAFVRERFPDATRIALTVNVTNERAIRAYRRAGFTDTGRFYTAGPLGAQHVLEYELG
jgi:RimJ/RimL family protein N-acetyltransferase